MIDNPTIASAGWAAPQGVTDFSGFPVPPRRDLFIQPPKELGRIVSAWSDVRVGRTLWPLSIKLVVSGAILAFGIAVLTWFANRNVANQRLSAGEVTVLMAAIVVPILSIAYAFKRKYLGYLGEKGAAVYSTRGRREDARGDVVLFANVANIEMIEKRRNKGWRECTMHFVNDRSERFMTLKGNYKVFGGRLIPTPIYQIAIGIQSGWRKSRS